MKGYSKMKGKIKGIVKEKKIKVNGHTYVIMKFKPREGEGFYLVNRDELEHIGYSFETIKAIEQHYPNLRGKLKAF